jgi:acetyltransferase-like isoleucine patch superfamily enzyme
MNKTTTFEQPVSLPISAGEFAPPLPTGALTNWLGRWRLRRAAQVVGADVVVGGKLVIANQGQLRVGANCRLIGDFQPLRLAIGAGATLTIGDNCTINSAIIAAHQQITIGAGCQLGPFVHLMDSDFHDLHDRSLAGQVAPICLEAGVRLGARTIVLRGVTIGRNAEIMPGSVVTKDIPAGAKAGGVPARVLEQPS